MYIYIRILLLNFITYSTKCYNIETTSSSVKRLLSPVLEQATAGANSASEIKFPANIRPSFYGLTLKVSKKPGSSNNLYIGSPKAADVNSPKIQPLITQPNQNPTGAVHDCAISKTTNATSSCSPKQLPGTGVGLSLGFSPPSNGVACSPAQVLKCLDQDSFFTPGFCYTSTDSNNERWGASGAIAKQQECPPDKSHPVDVMFVLDGSESIGEDNFNTVKTWVKNITKTFNPRYVNVGVIQYSYWYNGRPYSNQPFIKTEIQLGNIGTFDQFKGKVDKIKLHQYQTYTGRALGKAKLDFDKYGRTEAKKVMLLLTDGRSNDPVTVTKNSKILRRDGVLTFAVGVGEVYQNELRQIATGDKTSDERVYKIDNFDGLDKIAKQLQVTIRNIVLEAGSGKNASTKLENGEQGFAIHFGDKTSENRMDTEELQVCALLDKQ